MTEAQTTMAEAAKATQAGPHPDARLILACDAFIAAWEACEAYGIGEDGCPFYAAACEAEAAAGELEPMTMDGVFAMARVAAMRARQPAGAAYPDGEAWSDSFTGDWPERVCKAVLRLVPERRSRRAALSG